MSRWRRQLTKRHKKLPKYIIGPAEYFGKMPTRKDIEIEFSEKQFEKKIKQIFGESQSAFEKRPDLLKKIDIS